MLNSLIEFRKAVAGKVVMSEEYEDMGSMFMQNLVPNNWVPVSFLSLKPLSSYMLDFSERVAFIQGWIDHNIYDCVWVSGFFFPQAFFTGILQNYARKYQIAVDKLDFNFYIKSLIESHTEVKSKPENGS